MMAQNVLQHIHFPLPKRDLSLQVSNQVVVLGQGLLQEAVYSTQDIECLLHNNIQTYMQTYIRRIVQTHTNEYKIYIRTCN